MAEPLRAGFIGLGDMGGPIAQRIIDAGLPLTLWARRPSTLDQYRATDFVRADTPAEVGSRSDVVGVCVFGDADLRDVMCGEQGVVAGMARGGTILIHSTASVAVCAELASLAAQREIDVLDAPVSGGRRGAKEGTLTIMVGGEPPVLDRVLPVLRTYGSIIRLMGPLGSGQRMKMLNNALSNSIGRLAAMAIETGYQLGLDTPSLLEVLRTGGARSFSLDSLIDRVMVDPSYAAHAMTMIAKDTSLYQEMRRAAGLPPTALDLLPEERSLRIAPSLANE